MKQVPNMISTKDLLNLTDMFNWHFNVVKKAYNYSDLCKDEEISSFIKDVGKQHLKICEKIIKKLES